MALGTVGAGSKKEQVADITAGIIINSGLTPTAIVVAAKLGNSNVVVTVLGVISVRNLLWLPPEILYSHKYLSLTN